MFTTKELVIGVSGDEGSFSEEAALIYIKKTKIDTFKLQYLINMDGVLAALAQGTIDRGVFPVANKNSGLVWPALEAMGKYEFTPIDTIDLNVEQCLFAKTDLELEQISSIYSFAPAIEQCKKFVRGLKKIPIIDWGDMAKAARDLANGELLANAAVLGSRRSAEHYGLQLIATGVQDVKINTTMFVIASA